jgi:energy-coupling factor transporter transmembrane protein EcfT
MARSGPVRSIAPSARLLVLLLITGTIFSASPQICLILFFVALVLLKLEGLRLSALRRELPGFALLCIMIVALEGLSWEDGLHVLPSGITSAGFYCLRLASAILFGRLFYLATSSSELREAAGALGRILPGSIGEDLALSLSLILGFIPMIVGEWALSSEAGKARGIESNASLVFRLKIVEAFVRRLSLRALQLPEVLVARGWTGEKARTARPWGTGSRLAVLATSIIPLLELSKTIAASLWR